MRRATGTARRTQGPDGRRHPLGWLRVGHLLCDLSLAEGSVQRTPVRVPGHTVRYLTQGDPVGARRPWGIVTSENVL